MNRLSIYKSSAGSGKTFTLVKEYLKLVLENPSAYRQTLAITFTNKATAEMKQRIVEALAKLSEDNAFELKQLLVKELQNPAYSITERAHTVLENIMHDYSGFAVSTIDSFFSRLVRSLAKEMHLPLKFEMEMNQEFISTRLAEMLLDDIGKSDELTHWLEQFVFTRMEEEKGWRIEHEIKLIAKEVFTARQQELPEDSHSMTLAFIHLLKKIKASFEIQLRQFGKEFVEIINQNNLEVKDFAFDKTGVANYFVKISEDRLPEKWEPGSRVKHSSESAEKWTTRTSVIREKILSLAESKLIPLTKKTLSFYENNKTDYKSASRVLAIAYMAGIVHFLKEKLTAYRDEHEVLMLSDNNFLIRKFISGNDTPFLYEKTGNRYSNFLIDEFQDTSDQQWDNLLPLLLNGLASGGFVMLVGDAKQSIYRWRGGNLRLLLESIHTDTKAFHSIREISNLDTNYRSFIEIIRFNNTFFTGAPHLLPVTDKLLTGLAYYPDDTCQKHLDKKSSGGYVEINLLKSASEEKNRKKNLWKKPALDKLLEQIKRCEQKGYNLQEMVILIRSNKEGKEIASFLFSNGYTKIASAESLLISQAPQVVFLINLLKVLAYPDDAPALGAAIHFYCSCIKQQPSSDQHRKFLSVVKDTRHREEFLPLEWLKQKKHLVTLPVYELTEQLLSLFSLNLKPDAYIQRFQDLMLEYSGKNPPSLKGFLQWWEDHKDNEKHSVIMPSDKNAINILSIHRSKGLQFPVVMLPFLDWDMLPKSKQLLWISSEIKPYNQLSHFPVKASPELASTHFAIDYQQEVDHQYLDNLNLLYVAFTRAESKLFLTGPLVEFEPGKVKRVSQLISGMLSTVPEWKDNRKELEDRVELITGEDQNATARSNEGAGLESTVSMEQHPVNRWQDRLTIRVSDGFRLTGDPEILSPVDFGLLLHETMSMIKKWEDCNNALSCMKARHDLKTEEMNRLTMEVDLVKRLTAGRNWFEGEWTILNETEIAVADGIILRPDRVMVSGNEAIVLDYKSGLPENTHQTQINEYIGVLRQMGYENTRGYLLYLPDNKVVEVI